MQPCAGLPGAIGCFKRMKGKLLCSWLQVLEWSGFSTQFSDSRKQVSGRLKHVEGMLLPLVSCLALAEARGPEQGTATCAATRTLPRRVPELVVRSAPHRSGKRGWRASNHLPRLMTTKDSPNPTRPCNRSARVARPVSNLVRLPYMLTSWLVVTVDRL